MGTFTTITDKETSISVQIYAGIDDFCEEYNIGNKVPQRIIETSPGDVYFDDDIYISGCNKFWVIVQNAKIIAIEKRIILAESDNFDEII